MHSFTNRNINTMFPRVMSELLANGEREESRNGPVIVYPEPVCMTYERPWERVLFSAKRRANPFFHLFESMWMLAGRDDAGFLDRYVHDFGARYAEEYGRLHGAYGRRWRSHFGMDQLDWAVQSLQRDPSSRRTVITMYDPDADSVSPDIPVSPKDIPCNTQIYLRLRKGALELTVCCRSNDAIWGAFGANVVHFSVLQEYLAHRIGCGIGPMHVMSNNFHVYESTLHLFDPDEDIYDPYSVDHVAPHPLFTFANDGPFIEILNIWMADPSNVFDRLYPAWPFANLLIPMSRVHDAIKAKIWNLALAECEYIIPEDWREAAKRWIITRPGAWQ